MCHHAAMPGICDGRVVIVTGAGRGIGRGHALEFARQGASVVVNDIGAELDGTGARNRPPARWSTTSWPPAVGPSSTATTWPTGRCPTPGGAALGAFGRLDVVVNNAGIVRDRMLVSCDEDEWDAVVRVHLKGHFAVARFAAEHWRSQAKAGEPSDARIVNTSSGAGLMGSVGQSAYSAAKAGIAALTLVQAAELGRYGVTANAIAPSARTRMTETVFAEMMAAPDDAGAFDAMAPDNVAPLVVWLGSAQSAHVTGRVFEVEGARCRWPTVGSTARGRQRRPLGPGGAGPGRRRAARRGAAPGPGLRRRSAPPLGTPRRRSEPPLVMAAVAIRMPTPIVMASTAAVCPRRRHATASSSTTTAGTSR